MTPSHFYRSFKALLHIAYCKLLWLFGIEYPDDKRQYHQLVRVIVRKLEAKCARKKLKLSIRYVDATNPQIIYYHYSLKPQPRGQAYKGIIRSALSSIRELGKADIYVHQDKIIVTYPHH